MNYPYRIEYEYKGYQVLYYELFKKIKIKEEIITLLDNFFFSKYQGNNCLL